jgi:hypothetical protein
VSFIPISQIIHFFKISAKIGKVEKQADLQIPANKCDGSIIEKTEIDKEKKGKKLV